MKLIVPFALPPASTAAAVADPFAKRYPKLAHLFNAKQANQQPWSVRDHGCTPAEGLMLQLSGYRCEAEKSLASGLGPLHAGIQTGSDPVWVAQLCATVISQERTTVLPLDLIDASHEAIDALEASAGPLMAADNDDIEIRTLGQGLWRIHTTVPLPGRTISPLALMGQDLGDWWPTHPAWRAWRKRVNEIQMAWHDHPVNHAREARGLPAINSVWLYGGGLGFEPTDQTDHHWLDQLQTSALQGDWSAWLERWAQVEPILLNAAPDHEIVLTGDDRIVGLHNAPVRWWQNLFTKQQHDNWRHWWVNQK